MPSRRCTLPLIALWLCLLLLPAPLLAQTRAWLDRDRIALGQSTTLNIETDQASVNMPDYTPLQTDFRLSGHSSSRSFETVNGVSRTRVLFAIALEPRRAGNLAIPALAVGNARTNALQLQVAPANTAIVPAPARSGEAVFLDTEVDAQQPYVQQAVGYTLRLYYATQLISGSLDQPSPQGASLQQVGQAREYTAQVGGTRYNVVERRYLLIPERSGALTIPAPRFEGQGVGGFFDELFGDGRRGVRANGQPRTLQVRPPPPNAPQPWLPLRDLQLRYLEAPQSARAGEASTVTLEMSADGANATQLPELTLTTGDGAQIFPEAPQLDESTRNGRPMVRVTRRFSVVPAQAGALRIEGPPIAWWDVQAGMTRHASLPTIAIDTAVGAQGQGAVAASGAADLRNEATGSVRVPFVQGRTGTWAAMAVLFALLWLATLWWGLQRRQRAAPVAASDVVASANASASAANASSGRHAGSPAPARLRDLQQALQQQDLAKAARLLCAMASPPAADLRQLRERLDDTAQRDAIDLLQRARWGQGDAQTACDAVRDAFANGPTWMPPARQAAPLLPPLYPQG